MFIICYFCISPFPWFTYNETETMDDLISFDSPECHVSKVSTGADEVSKCTMPEYTIEANDLLEFSDVMDFLPNPLSHIDKKMLKSLEKAVRVSTESGIICDHCKGNLTGAKYICISCKNAPTLCDECLKTKHTDWHITIRKPLLKSCDESGDDNDSKYYHLTDDHDEEDEEQDAKSDLSFDCRSFLHYDDDEIRPDDDMRGSYTTCSTFDLKDNEAWVLDVGDDDDSSTTASSEWDRFSIVSMPDCFNLDRPPDLLKTSLVKVPRRIVMSDWNISSEDCIEVEPKIDDLLMRQDHEEKEEEEEEEGLTWVEPPEDPIDPAPLDLELSQDLQKYFQDDETYKSPSIDQEIREYTAIKYVPVAFEEFDVLQGNDDTEFQEIDEAETRMSEFPLQEKVHFVPAVRDEVQFVSANGVEAQFESANRVEAHFESANRVEAHFESANRKERQRVESFERSFHDVRDPFSYSDDSSQHVVDLLAHAAQQVSGVAMRTVDTFKRVFRAFHNDNLQCPVKIESYDWIPPAMKWSGTNAEHPSTSDGIMKALIEMGFADRALNGVLIKKFENNFEMIIDYIIAEGYCYTGWL